MGCWHRGMGEQGRGTCSRQKGEGDQGNRKGRRGSGPCFPLHSKNPTGLMNWNACV